MTLISRSFKIRLVIFHSYAEPIDYCVIWETLVQSSIDDPVLTLEVVISRRMEVECLTRREQYQMRLRMPV